MGFQASASSRSRSNLDSGQGEVVLQFNPHLAPMNRGIITTITVPSSGASIEDLYIFGRLVW